MAARSDRAVKGHSDRARSFHNKESQTSKLQLFVNSCQLLVYCALSHFLIDLCSFFQTVISTVSIPHSMILNLIIRVNHKGFEEKCRLSSRHSLVSNLGCV